jgi:hypothetical protein
MRALMYSAAVLAAVVVAAPLRADDDAAKIIEQAAKAHGGVENLSKHKDKSVIQSGKIHITTMGVEIDGTMETMTGGGKFRQDLKLSFMGNDIAQSVVFDGKEFWIAVNGMVMMSSDKKEDIDLIKESIFAEKAAGMAMLGDKSLKLSVIGDDKVDDTPVVGIRVSKEGHKDVSLYFDKKTHLLKKVVSRGLNFQTKAEVESERVFDAYKEFDGQMRPTKASVSQDGSKLLELEIKDFKYVDKFDEDTFAKPK